MQVLRAVAVVLTSMGAAAMVCAAVAALAGQRWTYALAAVLLCIFYAGATWLGFRNWLEHSPRHRRR